MAFRDFTLSNVRERLGLTVRDERLFAEVRPLEVRAEFRDTLLDGLNLATAINTEKARSELGIAPTLLELWRMSGNRFRFFSGVEWTVDADRGLNGYCDYLLTWGPTQYVLTPPFAVVVEAKNAPILNGLGQCMAAMYAAVVANRAAGVIGIPIYGAVTNGEEWKFLRIDDQTVSIDIKQEHVADLPRLFGVLDLITRRPVAVAA